VPRPAEPKSASAIIEIHTARRRTIHARDTANPLTTQRRSVPVLRHPRDWYRTYLK